jgi:hypothetical protein
VSALQIELLAALAEALHRACPVDIIGTPRVNWSGPTTVRPSLADYGRDNENFVLVVKIMCLIPLRDIKGNALG